MTRLTARDKVFIGMMCAATTIMTANYALMAAFFPVYMTSRGMSAYAISVIFVAFEIGRLVFSIFAGRLASHFGRRQILIWGIVQVALFGCCMGIIPDLVGDDSSPTALAFTAARCLQGGGVALAQMSIIAILSDAFPDNRGLVVGSSSSCLALGYFVGPPLGGTLFAMSGFRLPFLALSALLALFAGPVLWLYPAQSKPAAAAIRSSSSSTHSAAALSATATAEGIQCASPSRSYAKHSSVQLEQCNELVGSTQPTPVAPIAPSDEPPPPPPPAVAPSPAAAAASPPAAASPAVAPSPAAAAPPAAPPPPSWLQLARSLPVDVWVVAAVSLIYMSKWAWWDIYFTSWCVGEFHASIQAASLYISFIAAVFGIAAPFSGSLGDRLGDRRMELVATALAVLVVAYAVNGPWQVDALALGTRSALFFVYLVTDGLVCCLIEPQLAPQMLSLAEDHARSQRSGPSEHLTNMVTSLGQT